MKVRYTMSKSFVEEVQDIGDAYRVLDLYKDDEDAFEEQFSVSGSTATRRFELDLEGG